MKFLPFDDKDMARLDELISQETRLIYGAKRGAWVAEARKNQKAKREAEKNK